MLATTEQYIEALEAENRNAARAITDLRRQLDRVRSEGAAETRRVKQAALDAHKRLQAQLAGVEATLRSTNALLADRTRELRTAEDRNAALRAQLETANVARDSWRRAAAQLEHAVLHGDQIDLEAALKAIKAAAK